LYGQVNLFTSFSDRGIMEPLYRKVHQQVKNQILAGVYREGDLLPSEKELQLLHTINRSTVRQALNELAREGYIIKKQGKGSIVVRSPRRTLGLLSVKGFSEVVGQQKHTVKTVMIEKPAIRAWDDRFFYPLSHLEQQAGCIYMKRLRCVEDDPVMLEITCIPNLNLPGFCNRPFIGGSLFETLNVKYQVEITRVEQDLRAVSADREAASLLGVTLASPLLHIYLHFFTSREHLHIYSSLLCNTSEYSIGNKL